ncbi:5-oxoprolinase/urea amidolyase family protein [Kribbella antibiotica]|uniref:5-oxoprolinase/urea amidolyase family protein n=1 Tax=Kribbella antibiotica TaxID=190195 RepID=A0A4R4Z879_9ACTN|nr:5-oxoprolinase/urea amidolyase family protein [Kribbella antibiotica]TDD54156.1 5-oxoprolinase/urea amidolyase family protein [Kribbella antibiotica]
MLTVISPGLQTTIQDLEGRPGLWDVGVPPSGAADELTFALVNAAVGNPSSAAGLECVQTGPVLTCDEDRLICVGGAAKQATIDGWPVRPGLVVMLPAGAVLDLGLLDGMRGYLAIEGGIDVPPVLGSRATFVLGGFGGQDGRPLAANDQLPLGRRENLLSPANVELPTITDSWQLRVIPGPHGAPDHLTVDGVEAFFGTSWTVDHRSDRTGVRLSGPLPGWARSDGGEAGLHPSNVHDSAYPVGGIMLSGDTPVIVGKDGPSLGGFVVPAVVIEADRWMLGQLCPGDTVELVPVAIEVATAAMSARRRWLADLRQDALPAATIIGTAARPDVLHEASGYTIRCAGERHVLVEAGSAELDLTVRVWVHLLAEALREHRPTGVVEIVEGVRSLLVALDTSRLGPFELAKHLVLLTSSLADPETVVLPAREVTLPIAFDHPEAHEAMRRYAASVRPDAPWCPDNVEFIRRVNDLDERDEVFEIVQQATYLVVGLGDVYLGAPVAVPIDPRHRLVTTKYNPARTWTPQNAVGIGGIYLCVYGMEGPGGYQLVGRTVPVWRLQDERPWLLRQFDKIRFTPVSVEQLAHERAEIAAGRADLKVAPATFSIAEVRRIEQEAPVDIATLRARRRAAFDAERARWGA